MTTFAAGEVAESITQWVTQAKARFIAERLVHYRLTLDEALAAGMIQVTSDRCICHGTGVRVRLTDYSAEVRLCACYRLEFKHV